MNFAGEQFRVYAGKDAGDVIIAKRKMNPNIWTHIAVIRDPAGKFRIYLNGELDNADSGWHRKSSSIVASDGQRRAKAGRLVE